MPDLILMRHSKSAYPLGVTDHDRPLNDRGSRDAQAARQWFAQQAFAIDEAWVSSARRAQQTWSGVEPGVLTAAAPSFVQTTVPALYEASVGRLMTLLAQATASTLLVVAHNPGIEQLIDRLTGRDPQGWLAHITLKYPTGAVCVLRLPTWGSLSAGEAELLTYAVPRAS
ncbi:MAG: SixA phosphatase family protein [Actinomycetes bacterium]